MENEKLTYINSRGERLELGVDSVYHCNISKDVEGISGVTSVIYSTNSMGQHGDTYVGQRIEARDIDVVGHINTRDKAQALELRRRMLKIFNPELSATLVYEYGGFKRVIDCRAYGEPKILKKEVLYEFDLQIECLNPFWREEEETKEDGIMRAASKKGMGKGAGVSGEVYGRTAGHRRTGRGQHHRQRRGTQNTGETRIIRT